MPKLIMYTFSKNKFFVFKFAWYKNYGFLTRINIFNIKSSFKNKMS